MMSDRYDAQKEGKEEWEPVAKAKSELMRRELSESHNLVRGNLNRSKNSQKSL